MFVYNVKINGKNLFKIFFIVITIIVLTLFGFGTYKIFSTAHSNFTVSDISKNPDVVDITTINYTNVLKEVHENIDSYVGTKIHFTGYVYRVIDLSDNEFIIARDMLISSDYQSVVVGFLCKYDHAKDFIDNTWIEVTGEITKGNYHGDMPIINITDIKTVQKPTDEYVYPPDNSYIPTSSLI